MATLYETAAVALIGVGATAIMDTWLVLLRLLGAKTLDLALLGRWVGHLARGRFTHASLAQAKPVPGELGLGWATHYAVGIAFAGLLVAIAGSEWTRRPSLLVALAVGAGTVVAPLFVMQPAMGAGFAGSRTAAPLANCLRSIASHAVFGAGLYVTAALIASLMQRLGAQQ
jgi:hypothetical protein